MRFKAWWRSWESKRQDGLGALLLMLFVLLFIWICRGCAHDELVGGLLKDGYNITKDWSKLEGAGRYTIQIWYDGQWNDVLRCGE